MFKLTPLEHIIRALLFLPLLLVNAIDIAYFYVLYWIRGSSIQGFDSKLSTPHVILDKRDWVKARPVTNQDLSSESNTEETVPYRNVKHMDKLLETPIEGVSTLDELLSWTVKQFGDRRAVGRRLLEKMEEKVVKQQPQQRQQQETQQRQHQQKKWQIAHYRSEIEWLTYRQLGESVDRASRGLQMLMKNVERDSEKRLMLFENTCMEWMIMAHACSKAQIVFSTVYANLGTKALIGAINETESSILFTNVGEVKRIASSLVENCPKLLTVICNFDGIPESERENYQIPTISPNIKVMSMKEVEELGKSSQEEQEKTAKTKKTSQKERGNELACIMYTSGTTGTPKGVLLTHRQVLSCIAGIDDSLKVGDDEKDEKYSLGELNFLGYLPLAHILEFVTEHVMFVRGGNIGYGSPRTLTSSGAKPCGDLDAYQPTVLVGVPKMFETIRKKAMERVKSSGMIGKCLFQSAFSYKLRSIRRCRATPLWDRILFNKFKQLIGGRVKIMLSGGAPLGVESQEFIRVCFGATFIQGYGLTETAGAVCIQGVFDPFETRVVGVPIASCEIKLVSQPEMGYLVTDKPCPRGELVVRGNNISQGYYRQKEETRKAFQDGWFFTGDIAEIEPDGVVKIVDRKKNLVKLSGGEYVALEHLESLYSTSDLVTNIMIHADQSQDTPVALIVPNMKPIKEWAKQNGLSIEDRSKLIKSRRVSDYVRDQLVDTVGSELKSFEKLKSVRLVDEPWTVENDLITSAQKLKRKSIEDKYKDLLGEMKDQQSEA